LQKYRIYCIIIIEKKAKVFFYMLRSCPLQNKKNNINNKSQKTHGGITMEKITLTANGILALSFLQQNDGAFTGAQIAEATGLNKQGVHGVLNSLVKKGLVIKGDAVIQPVINREGLTEERSYVTYVLTDLGAEFIVAE
jgi:DNA-binding MarR family transcriptional regulator